MRRPHAATLSGDPMLRPYPATLSGDPIRRPYAATPCGDPMLDMGRPAKIEGDLKDHDFQFDVDNRGQQSIPLDLTKNDALVPLIDAVLMTKSRDEWGIIMDEHGIIWAPVLGLHEVVNDPQAEAINLFPTLALEGVGRYRTVRIPMNFHTFDALPSEPAPTPGQHTHKVLSERGYAISEINALAESGVLSWPGSFGTR